MAVGYVYKITSPSGKIYIGSTSNLERRMSDYGNLAAKQQIKVFRSIQKHGRDKHKFEVILITTMNYMLTAERLLGEYYNCLDSKRGLNCRLPKIGEMRCVSDETRRKISIALTGKKHSEATKIKLRAAHNKERRYAPCSEEAKKKIGLKHAGKIISVQHKEQLRIINTGKVISEATRQKLSTSLTGRVISNEARIKISNAHRGKIVSDESKAKMSRAKIGKASHPNSLRRLIPVRKGDKRPPSVMQGCIEAKWKMVMDLSTGIFYCSATEAQATLPHIKAKTFRAMMSGQLKNRTSMIYV